MGNIQSNDRFGVKGYWRASCMPDCTHAMSGHNLYRAGYRFLMDYYVLVS